MRSDLRPLNCRPMYQAQRSRRRGRRLPSVDYPAPAMTRRMPCAPTTVAPKDRPNRLLCTRNAVRGHGLPTVLSRSGILPVGTANAHYYIKGGKCMSSRAVRRIVALASAFTLLATIALTTIGAQDSRTTTPAATPSLPAVVRDVLAADLPAAAPGQELQLVRYVIQPDTRLATHIHPGTQIASIEAGVLTYTVVTGEVP